jgi:hypothetical protein
MGEIDGYKFNPVKEGYTLFVAHEGIPFVETTSGFLGLNEYCDYDDGYFIVVKNPYGKITRTKVEKTDIEDTFLVKDLWR